MKRRNLTELKKWQEKAAQKFARPEKVRVRICITGCRANGALGILAKFQEETRVRRLTPRVEIVPTGCQKFCSGAPVVSVDLPSRTIMYQKVEPKDIPAILRETVSKEKVIPRLLLQENRFFDSQTILVSKNCGYINPLSLEEYLGQKGFGSLVRVLTEMTPDQVLEEVKKSRLRGRGGAGFLTGLKWELTRKAPGLQKYLICNGDEGDPGAFMDRAMLEGCPYQVIEGMLIAGYAIGCNRGYIYVRAEYAVAIEHLKYALKKCYQYGLLGKEILGEKFSFDLEIKEGAGAFVCGEETALIFSIEGKRGMPRPRPPFPAQAGLWGRPTCINNVETLANIPLVIEQGGENFAALGTPASGGTKLFSLAGKVKNTGLVEVPLGISLGKLLFEVGGGALPGRKLKGVQIGGPSGGCLPVSQFNTPVDYETLTGLGAIMGSGGMIGVDDKVCMVEFARYFIDFVQKESCGKCVPCRIGTKRLLECLTEITRGRAGMAELEKLAELSEMVKLSSLCGLGQTAPNPVLTTLRYFPEEYAEHVRLGYCRAGQCRDLVFTPCENACPAHVRVSDYLQAIRNGDFLTAYRIIAEDIPFPSVCGRICYHPCEAMCRRLEVDQSVAIRELKKFAAEQAEKNRYSLKDTRKFKPALGKQVAVVGGGPAGLTCAWYLSQEGVAVTIFEQEKELGGMLRYYVPEFRLPRKVLDKEIGNVLNSRIKVWYGRTLGKNLRLQDLEQRFDAVFLALGAGRPQAAGIPGENLKGVYQGLEFLRQVKEGRRSRPGGKVGIIGGGNVALDCARSALRTGAEEVTVFYRRTREFMPSHHWELAEAEKEGVKFEFLVSPLRIKGGLHIREVVFQEFGLSESYDSDGRRKITEVPGKVFSRNLDTLILALGQKSLISSFLKDQKIDDCTHAVPGRKVFVGGDFFRGPATVIEAIGDGKRAGRCILRFLLGQPLLPVTIQAKREPESPKIKEEPLNIARQKPETISPDRRRQTFAEVEKVFSRIKAVREARRCLLCQYEK